MFKRVLFAGVLIGAAYGLLTRSRPARAEAAPAPRPQPRLPSRSSPPARRAIHPELTGAAMADRWDQEGSGDLVSAASRF